MKLRERIIYERNKNGFTQKEVAEMLGVSEVYVRKIEKGVSNASLETMLKFEKLYNVCVRKLFPDRFDVFVDTKCIKNK